ncbi:MAG TPA: response regulator transcription factor [Patescibacteria group bacterium]|nr:response regulator transcription factor [Patescibacteria group bacterium]
MRILVIEDERRIANTIKKGLEQERYAVDTAYDGTSGYDLASSEDYDLILLDLLLPGIDGMTICKNLRTAKVETPILILTAKGQIEDKIAGLNAGADDYLTKPFSFEELLARIRALTRRPKNVVSNVLKASDLELDIENFKVTKKGKRVKLSSKEFSLLEYFMRHPDKIISKDTIINHVWDYDADILPNTVEVYIRNLRKKGIDVETERGFGYRLSSK